MVLKNNYFSLWPLGMDFKCNKSKAMYSYVFTLISIISFPFQETDRHLRDKHTLNARNDNNDNGNNKQQKEKLLLLLLLPLLLLLIQNFSKSYYIKSKKCQVCWLIILGIISLDMGTYHNWNYLEGEEDCRRDTVLLVAMQQNSTTLLFCFRLLSLKSLQLESFVTESKIWPFYTMLEVKDKLSSYAFWCAHILTLY